MRLGIYRPVKPGVVVSIASMSAVPGESVDATFICQTIEHPYPHEVPIALKEFMGVPKSEGFTVITCFTYQNFPGQFKHLAPALVREGQKLLGGTKTIIVRKILFDMSFFLSPSFLLILTRVRAS